MPNILIVDDERQICEQLTELLSEFGYESGFILHPRALFPRIKNELFDLILLDVNMPEIDGVTLLQQLKADPQYKNLPVVMLTSEVNDQLVAQCFENGAEDFVNKPINHVVLKARLQSVLATQNYIRAIREQRNQMQDELLLAEEAQRLTLPKLPPVPFTKVSVIYQPLGNVSGDMYDLSLSQEGVLNAFIGDGTGHGVAAAFITMMVNMGLRSIPDNLPTDEIVRQLNAHLFACVPLGSFMTGIYMRIFPIGLVHYTKAGHPPPLVIRAHGVDVMESPTNGMPLGMFEKELTPFLENTVQLYPGDKLLLYTDGTYESRNPENEEFGWENMKKFLEENYTEEMDTLLVKLLEHLKTFSKGASSNDDLTILGFDFR